MLNGHNLDKEENVIVGIGADLCDIRRIERTIQKFDKRFITRIFTGTEIAKAEKSRGNTRLGTYAKRWAAKEACAKALGTGFSEGVFYHDIEVVNLPSGQPTLRLFNGALKQLHKITGIEANPSILLTMTDEYPYAFAQVMIQIDAS